MNDPFEKKNKSINLSFIEELIADFYGLVSYNLQKQLDRAYKAELFNNSSEEHFDIGNDYHYLLSLIISIYMEMYNDAKWNERYGIGCKDDKGTAYYYDKYNIDCIKKHFLCMDNFDIKDVLGLIGLDDKNDTKDGIGYMSIDYSYESQCDSDVKPFQVT